ncbi:MAG: hypothetical protein ACRDIC_07860 [bacterium]
MSLLGLGGATLQVFFESARPYLVAATLLSLGFSFYVVYRRPFRPRPQVIRLWVTAALAAILMIIPVIRG